MLTLKQLIQRESEKLLRVSDSPVLDVELLVLSVLKQDRSFLYAYPQALVDVDQLQKIESLMSRRLNGEPIAYILGHKEFWSLDFLVTPDVLIPRPETELLVEQALLLGRISNPRDLAAGSIQKNVLDLGTGSGAIAIAIAKEKPAWHVTATDVSGAALKIAKENAHRHNVHNISFLQGSWFEALAPSLKFDIIISNPPYIAKKDPHLLQGDVRFEPCSSLVAGEDGLDDIRLIIEQAVFYLKDGGCVMLEHGYDQAEKVAKILKKNRYTHVQSMKDFAGNDRVTMAVRPR